MCITHQKHDTFNFLFVRVVDLDFSGDVKRWWRWRVFVTDSLPTAFAYAVNKIMCIKVEYVGIFCWWTHKKRRAYFLFVCISNGPHHSSFAVFVWTFPYGSSYIEKDERGLDLETRKTATASRRALSVIAASYKYWLRMHANQSHLIPCVLRRFKMPQWLSDKVWVRYDDVEQRMQRLIGS